MSTRKDKFTTKERYYMNLAFNLAGEVHGLTGENPPVGCLIVNNDEIISIGQTGHNGRPHAEFNAIKSCKKNLKDSTMYVTLEPCTHYGKTPPCSNLIINSKIKKVIFSIIDFDKRTQAKSFKFFKKKNIKVKSGILEKKGNCLYEAYKINKVKNIPFVTGKLAVSKDNFIFSTKRKKITNKHSDKITHLLRYKNDSIMISSKTLNSDNPKLNCRLNGLTNFSPKRIILDKNLSISIKSYIFLTSKNNNTVIFFNKGNKNKIKLLKRKGIKLIHTSVNKDNLFDLKYILKKVFSLGCRNLLVEGGKTLTNNFLKSKLYNQFYLFKSPINLGSHGRLNVSNQLKRINFIYKNKSIINSFTGKDVVRIYS